MKELVDSIAAALSEISSAKYSKTSAFTSSGGDESNSYVAPGSTEESTAALEEFIKVVNELDAAQAALDNAYDKGLWTQFDALQRRLAAAQEAYDATLPSIGTGIGGGGGGAGFLAMSSGGMVPKYFATGGKSIGSDTVPAMLTPGEFVMNKGATKAFGPMLSAMNGSKYPSMLGGLSSPRYASGANNISSTLISQSYPQMSNVSVMPMTNMSSANVNTNSTAVYNYSVGINVNGSNSNPNDIARAVMAEIKNVDAQRIRSQRA